MDGNEHSDPISPWGSITVEVLDDVVLSGSAGETNAFTAKHARHTWWPASELGLPSGFKLDFDSLEAHDNFRRFRPLLPFQTFLLSASLVGQALLFKSRNTTGNQRNSYRLMRLIFQHGQRLQERFRRNFRRFSDLKVATAVCTDHSDSTILPKTLGLDASGKGKRWSLDEFKKRGWETAKRTEIEHPSEADCIHFALLEAARSNPISVEDLSNNEVQSLIRLGLFDLGPQDAKLNDDLVNTVMNRFVSALWKHLDDETSDFAKWFFQNGDTIVRQISKQKKGEGPVDRKIVRQVILEMVYKAHFYMADTIQLAMEAFQQAIPGLTAPERDWFQALYFRRQSLGGLSLAMLYGNNELFDQVIKEGMSAPLDEQYVGVLLRAMQYYQEMCSARRQADRDYKALSKHKNSDGRTALALPIVENDLPTSTSSHKFDALVDQLRKRRNATCNCENTDNWIAKVESLAEGEPIIINESCEVCGYCETTEVAMDELRMIASDLTKCSGGYPKRD